jgi:hypothetical protein
MQEEGELTTGKDAEMRIERARNTARQLASVDAKNTIKITIVQVRRESPSFPAGSEQVDSNYLFKNSISSLTF